MNQIFTAGYGGHPARSLVLAARRLNALVCDIRHTPFSKVPGYSKKELLASVDSRYFHVPDLGNVNHAGDGEIQLANPTRGINWILRLAQDRTLILLCGCKEFEHCHRRTVSLLLAQRGAVTQELEWPHVPKLDLEGLPDVALSILQPWAWLIANGHKDIENRSWSSRFRGEFLIHTGKGFDLDAHFQFMQDPEWRRRMPKLGDFDRGGIVGMARMTGCVLESESAWFAGPQGFTLAESRPLPYMGIMGAQGFFSVKAQLEKMRAMRQKKEVAGANH